MNRAKDAGAFAESLAVLAETFNEPLSTVKIEAYFEVLEPFDIDQVRAAVRGALRACTFHPRPAELRELIEGNAEDAAERAWASVLGEIRRVGYIGTPTLEPRTLRAVKELWGSWERLCQTLPREGPELVGWIKQFKATYQSVERDTARQLTRETCNPQALAFIDLERKRLR